MFIELHKPDTITINVDMIQYFVPADNGKHAMVSIPNIGWMYTKESYEQVKELIIECQKK